MHTKVIKRPDFLYSYMVVRLPKGVASYYTTSEELGLGEVQQLYGDNTKD